MMTKTDQGIGRPDPPPATRLNRLAIVVAAAVMSATLLVVALMVGRSMGREKAARLEREEAVRLSGGPARPRFLDRPPADSIQDAAEEQAPDAEAYDALLKEASGSAAFVPPGTYLADPYYDASPYDQGTASVPSPEEEALQRALRSSLMPQGLADLAARRAAQARPPGRTSAYDDLRGSGLYGDGLYGDGLYRSAVSEGRGVLLGTPPQSQQTMGVRGWGVSTPGATGTADEEQTADEPFSSEQFLRRAAHVRSGRSAYIAGELDWPASPYEVREGTLIEAFLITAIHSDLPGEVLAHVSRNVYDSQTQQALLIPKGTRLVGTYDSQLALGQGRLLVAWTRMVLPDGRSVDLPGLASKDLQGASGLTGHVDRHRLSTFGDALMLSVVGAGLALSQRRPDRNGSAYPSPRRGHGRQRGGRAEPRGNGDAAGSRRPCANDPDPGGHPVPRVYEWRPRAAAVPSAGWVPGGAPTARRWALAGCRLHWGPLRTST